MHHVIAAASAKAAVALAATHLSEEVDEGTLPEAVCDGGVEG